MNKVINLIAFFFFVVFFATSCEKEPILEVLQSSLTFTEDGGFQTISFSTNNDWTATVSGEGTWCTLNLSNGNSTIQSIKVTVTPNNSYDNRSVTVSIKSGNLIKQLEISQSERKAIILSKKNFEVPDSTNVISVEFNSNVPYQVIIAPSVQSWIKQLQAKSLTTNVIQFEISANTTFETRFALIKIKHPTLPISDTINIYQFFSRDRQGLFSIYESFHGSNWNRKTNWLSDKPISEWEGVVAKNGRVIKLDLSNNNLSGSIPYQISLLSNLTHLQLENNNISGNLSDGLSALSQIEYFNIQFNMLSGNVSSVLKESTRWNYVMLAGIYPQQDGYGLSEMYDGITLDGVTWAPVNVGYNIQHKYGLLFQWHRKYGQTYENELPKIIIRNGPVSLSDGSLYANKDIFFESSTLDWVTPSKTDWDMVPQYNPCPSGWRVPTISELEGLLKYFGGVSQTNSIYNIPGRWYGPDQYTNKKQSIFLPFAGSLGTEGEYNDRNEVGNYWAIEGVGIVGRSLSNFYGGYSSNGFSAKALGFSIRCVKE